MKKVLCAFALIGALTLGGCSASEPPPSSECQLEGEWGALGVESSVQCATGANGYSYPQMEHLDSFEKCPAQAETFSAECYAEDSKNVEGYYCLPWKDSITYKVGDGKEKSVSWDKFINNLPDCTVYN